MRALLSLGFFGLVLILAGPASAQMCGAGQGASAMGGMCGGSTGQRAADAPMTDKPAQPQSSMGCSCCKNMAMMRPQGGQSMPGMDMPKQ